jgi:hypothetical protein
LCNVFFSVILNALTIRGLIAQNLFDLLSLHGHPPPRPAIRQGFDTSLPARTQLIKSVRHRPAAPRCRRPCNALRLLVEEPSSARRQTGNKQRIDKLTPDGSVPNQDMLSHGIRMIRKKLPGG